MSAAPVNFLTVGRSRLRVPLLSLALVLPTTCPLPVPVPTRNLCPKLQAILRVVDNRNLHIKPFVGSFIEPAQ
jgi:hypothetical protein